MLEAVGAGGAGGVAGLALVPGVAPLVPVPEPGVADEAVEEVLADVAEAVPTAGAGVEAVALPAVAVTVVVAVLPFAAKFEAALPPPHPQSRRIPSNVVQGKMTREMLFCKGLASEVRRD
ncbi:MAG: hypothetical protein JO065_13085 [Acidobacteria bacterium]|nr:hypothetical protein [Acidobacteriota bacterium]